MCVQMAVMFYLVKIVDLFALFLSYFQLDINATEHISADDIRDFMKDLGEEVGGYTIQDMIKEVDMNDNGTIELEELEEVIFF